MKAMASVILLMKPLSLQFLRIPVEGHSNLQHRPRLQKPVTKECKDSEEYQTNSFEKICRRLVTKRVAVG
jgi:hypothetical protein